MSKNEKDAAFYRIIAAGHPRSQRFVLDSGSFKKNKRLREGGREGRAANLEGTINV